MSEHVQIIIVHPSRSFRSALEEALAQEPDIRVMASVRTCRNAMDVGRRRPPDLLVADVGMEDCLDILSKQNRKNGSGARMSMIVLAGRSPRDAIATIKALEAGAFDFVLLPDHGGPDGAVASVRRQLSVKLRHFASKRIFGSMRAAEAQPAPPTLECPAPEAGGADRLLAVVMGVSTGGPKVLANLMPSLCRQTNLPVFIAQHMPPGFTTSLAQSLNAKCPGHTVTEAQDGQCVEPGGIYIAPGGRHMLVARDKDRRPVIRINDTPPEEGCRPSANALFRSAATVYGSRVAAVVLTGMGSDGTKGLADLKRAGAHVIAQDEASSIVWGMPGSAVASGLVDDILPAADIAARIAKLMRQD